MDGGTDPAFGSDALYGATSLLHLLIVAVFTSVLDPLRALMVTAILSATAYASAGWAIACRYRSDWLAVSMALLFFSFGVTSFQLFNGLETGLALALLASGLYFATSGTTSAALPAMAILGLAIHARPEIAALAILVWIELSWRFRKQRISNIRVPIVLAGVMVAAWVPLTAWLFSRTGSFLPETMNAKLSWFAEGCNPDAYKWGVVCKQVRGFFLLGLPAVAGVCLSFRQSFSWITAAFVMAFFGAYFMTFPDALVHYDGRYLYVLVPCAVFCLVDWLGRNQRLAATVTTFSLVWMLGEAIPRIKDVADRDYGTTVNDLMPAAEWAQANIPLGSKILIHDAGYFPFATKGFLFTDLVGLKTPASVLVNDRTTRPSCGALRSYAIGQIAMNSNVQWVVVLSDWDRIFHITDSLRTAGYKLTKRFDGRYSIYELGR